MSQCREMVTRRCPGDECDALGCARFSRDEDKWTDAEVANAKKQFAEALEQRRTQER